MILCLGVHQELSPQKDDQALEEVPSPTGFPLSPDRLHAIEEVIAKGRSPHHEQQTQMSCGPCLLTLQLT